MPDPRKPAFTWHAAALRSLNWRARGSLRIIAYHGVCADHERFSPWVPSHYVTQSQLDEQLTLLRHYGHVIDLRELPALEADAANQRRPLAAVTFDDAPANLLRFALPVLEAHAIRATIFAVTDRLDDGGLLPSDEKRASVAADPAHAREALRHMTWHEARRAAREGHWIGAHSCSHAILSRFAPARREHEITQSILAIREKLALRDVPFAYPNGQLGDFDADDIRVLRRLSTPLACSGIAGPNRHPFDRLCLHRNGVGLFHTPARFVAELLGLRDGRHAAEHAKKSANATEA